MQHERVWQEIAGILRRVAPSAIHIGKLAGTHANFCKIDGQDHVLAQALWRPPMLRIGIALDDADASINLSRESVLSKLFHGELSAKLVCLDPKPCVKYMLYDLPLAQYPNENAIARDAAMILLFCVDRACGHFHT